VTAEIGAPVVAGLGLGIALASAPGPVQAVLMAESVRGGIGRGLRALAGANLTFGVLLVCLALGLSVAPPSGPVLRGLEVVGGALLVWLAVDGLRSGHEVDTVSAQRRGLHPSARGSLAIVLNPGAWLFLGAVASPLLGSASRAGGRPNAVLAAVALMVGAGVGDVGVVLLGGLGLRRAKGPVVLWIRRGLGAVLAGLGIWLVVEGLIP
jgi:threonine/homoserine/homoserine lactone efflux protein